MLFFIICLVVGASAVFLLQWADVECNNPRPAPLSAFQRATRQASAKRPERSRGASIGKLAEQ